MRTVKTYILRDGNVMSYPFTVDGAVKRAYFTGSTPYNERMCGTFQTADAGLQREMEAHRMFNNVYDLWITSSGDSPQDNAVALPADLPDQAGQAGQGEQALAGLTQVEVGSWAEAKIYLVEQHNVSKFTRNDPEQLAETARGLGISFLIRPEAAEVIPAAAEVIPEAEAAVPNGQEA